KASQSTCAIESVASSSWRNRRGEPQAGQRAASGGASATQSRQKLKLTARPQGKITARSRSVAFPIAAERAARPGNLGRIDRGAIGKGEQETLVGEHMLEHAAEKVRLGCR